MFTHTSTSWAPWCVIPADRKWFAQVAAAVIANALIEIDDQFPTLDDDARRDLQAAQRDLESQAPASAPADPFALPSGSNGDSASAAPTETPVEQGV